MDIFYYNHIKHCSRKSEVMCGSFNPNTMVGGPKIEDLHTRGSGKFNKSTDIMALQRVLHWFCSCILTSYSVCII